MPLKKTLSDKLSSQTFSPGLDSGSFWNFLLLINEMMKQVQHDNRVFRGIQF